MIGKRVTLATVIMLSLAFDASAQYTATAIVRSGTGTAEPTTICVANQGSQVRLTLDGFTHFVANVAWWLHGVGPDGTPIDQYYYNNVIGGDAIDYPVVFGRIGTATITATVTYFPGPGFPAPLPHSLSVVFTVEPPDEVEIVSRDSSQTYAFGGGFPLELRLKYDGDYCGGFNVFPKERIHFSVPSDSWQDGGAWIGEPEYLWVDQATGKITDIKAYLFDNWPLVSDPNTFVRYEQHLGVICTTMSGANVVIEVGQINCDSRKAPGGKWRMDVTD